MLKTYSHLAAVGLTVLSSLVALSTATEGASPAENAGWVAVTEKLGGTTVFADRTTGDAYLLRWNRGLLRSGDGGKTFERVDGEKICRPNSGPHTGYSAQISANGKKIAVFNFWTGTMAPSGYSLDGGETWQQFGNATRDRDWEFGAMDWDSGTAMAVPHETNNGLYVSTDAGKTWTELDKSGGNADSLRPTILGLGVLGPKALLVGYADRIERSADGGKSWTKVSDFSATGQAVKFKNKAWWLTRPSAQNVYPGYATPARQSVIVSDDQGKTWSAHGTPLPANAQGAWFGPLFGKDENHIVVAAGRGFYETTDGCKTWKLAARLPDGYDLKWIWRAATWDPIRDIFYVFNVNKPLMKYHRAGKKKGDGVYRPHAYGIVRDVDTGLEWKVGPDQDMNWFQAKEWVEKLNVDGGGWRLPTCNELEGIYRKGTGTRNMSPLLTTSSYWGNPSPAPEWSEAPDWWVWSSETKGSSDATKAKFFFFENGSRSQPHSGTTNLRAFAVRSLSDR